MATILSGWILILLYIFVSSVLCLPTFDPLSGKTGEDQVKEAVHKAELAAGKAALQSEKNGNSAELRVAAIKAKLAAQHVLKEQMKKIRKEHLKAKSLRKWGHLSRLHDAVKTYKDQSFRAMPRHHFRRPRHRKGFSNMISLDDLTSDATPQNNYQEDTTLEDRLALEAEEDKKYGGLSNNDYSSRSSLLNQDATQSIQNQVASESARELKEIQQQINAESQNSLGKTTIGRAATLFQGNPSQQQRIAQQKATARNGMIDVQSDLNSAFSNAEGMNTDSNIASPQINGNAENNIGANAFTGLGEETQPNNMGMDMQGLSSLTNNGQETGQSEQMGQGTANMEGQQETSQSAMSALAAGAGASFSNQQQQTPNDIGGLGGPGGAMENNGAELQSMQAFNGNNLGGGRLEEAKMLSGGGTENNFFGGNSMKKSKINNKNHS